MARSRECCLAALLLLGMWSVLCVSGQDLEISLRQRPQRSNLVTLICRMPHKVNAVENPIYFVLFTEMEEQLEYELEEDRTISFELTPELEGEYFCRANGEESDPIELVGE